LSTDTRGNKSQQWQKPSLGNADDLALLQTAPGTTALKKGVQFTHLAIHEQIVPGYCKHRAASR
jgi:acyl-CoA synthetase (AMP-forming)/AMP-acid ligase II